MALWFVQLALWRKVDVDDWELAVFAVDSDALALDVVRACDWREFDAVLDIYAKSTFGCFAWLIDRAVEERSRVFSIERWARGFEVTFLDAYYIVIVG